MSLSIAPLQAVVAADLQVCWRGLGAGLKRAGPQKHLMPPAARARARPRRPFAAVISARGRGPPCGLPKTMTQPLSPNRGTRNTEQGTGSLAPPCDDGGRVG